MNKKYLICLGCLMLVSLIGFSQTKANKEKNKETKQIKVMVITDSNSREFKWSEKDQQTNKKLKELKILTKIEDSSNNDYDIELVESVVTPTRNEKVYVIRTEDNSFHKKIITTPTTKKIFYIVRDKNNPEITKEIMTFYQTPTTLNKYNLSSENGDDCFEVITEKEENKFFSNKENNPRIRIRKRYNPGQNYPYDVPPVPQVKGNGRIIKRMEINSLSNNNKAVLGVAIIDKANGALVTEVFENSAAEKIGLKEGDIIVKVNGLDINENQCLAEVIKRFDALDSIDLVYKREGVIYKEKNVVLQKNVKGNFEFDFNGDKYDFVINNKDQKYLGGLKFLNTFIDKVVEDDSKPTIGIRVKDIEESNGVEITKVDSNSAGSKAGLQIGDLLTKVKNVSITDVESLKKELKDIQPGDNIEVELNRQGKKVSTIIKIKKIIQEADL